MRSCPETVTAELPAKVAGSDNGWIVYFAVSEVSDFLNVSRQDERAVGLRALEQQNRRVAGNTRLVQSVSHLSQHDLWALSAPSQQPHRDPYVLRQRGEVGEGVCGHAGSLYLSAKVRKTQRLASNKRGCARSC